MGLAVNILLPLRPGEQNQELLLAARSWEKNFVHGVRSLTVVGDHPKWFKPDYFIKGNGAGIDDRNLVLKNVYTNILKACQDESVPEDLIVMNDDFFLMEGFTEIGMTYRGFLSDHIALQGGKRSWWSVSLDVTMELLQERGIVKPVSFDLHRPFPIKKSLMRQVLEEYSGNYPRYPQWRTMYGNIAFCGSAVKSEDGKYRGSGALNTLTGVASTSDDNFGRVSGKLRRYFPEPSRWEV